MGKAKKGPGRPQSQLTWAQAWRDVMNKAISSGQIVPTSIAIVLMIAFWRMPESELSPLMNRILDGLSNRELLGWILLGLALCVWSWHSSVMRRRFSAEVNRIGKEKTRHQQANTTQPLGSSE
ncbi:hypothetical protein FDP13_05885 [Dickeya sp. ws52]|nr:hypothetical protein FDP13_05885 [Dickeya sp. ws52]